MILAIHLVRSGSGGNNADDWEEHPAIGKGYLFVGDKVVWARAVRICHAFGGKLAMPKEKEENDAVEGSAVVGMIGTKEDRVWLGLRRAENDCEFKWIDGKLPAWTNWVTNMPCSARLECAVMDSNADLPHSWTPTNCTEKYGFVCERLIETPEA
ncbi:hypothetical protein AAVH_27659 [Aphelenchoides avenae]|nr:hypothetical protein AAVH_27659 [Aphelenchus avenae]